MERTLLLVACNFCVLLETGDVKREAGVREMARTWGDCLLFYIAFLEAGRGFH